MAGLVVCVWRACTRGGPVSAERHEHEYLIINSSCARTKRWWWWASDQVLASRRRAVPRKCACRARTARAGPEESDRALDRVRRQDS